MQKPARVDVIERPQALRGEVVEALAEIRPADGGEVPSGDVLHGQERPVGFGDRPEIVDIDQIRMAQAGHRAELILEPLGRDGVQDIRSQELEGDLAVPLGPIAGKVNLAHPSFTQRAH